MKEEEGYFWFQRNFLWKSVWARREGREEGQRRVKGNAYSPKTPLESSLPSQIVISHCFPQGGHSYTREKVNWIQMRHDQCKKLFWYDLEEILVDPLVKPWEWAGTFTADSWYLCYAFWSFFYSSLHQSETANRPFLIASREQEKQHHLMCKHSNGSFT